MTCIDNLEAIVSSGRLLSTNELQRLGHRPTTSIAFPGVQDIRATAPVRCGPGGVVHDYVPFYFAPRSPMLFTIHKGNVDGYDGGQENIAYLVSKLDFFTAGSDWVFGDGNMALHRLTEAYDDLADLDKVDWPLMKERYWHNTPTDSDRMRRRMAEFMVHTKVEWSNISGIATYNEEKRLQIQETFTKNDWNAPTIAVKRNWYF